MKALTLTQPWATLVAVGAKTIETRSWGTQHRGPLAIHAAKGLAYPVLNETGLSLLVEEEPFRQALLPHLGGYTAEERAANLPRGGIVAVVTVIDCLHIELARRTPSGPLEGMGDAMRDRIEREAAFGDYSWGRYAWVFGRSLNIHDPIECRGGRGLWDVPEEVRLRLAEITDMAMTPEEERKRDLILDNLNADPERQADIERAFQESR